MDFPRAFARKISPPRSALDRLRQPLTAGEAIALDVFDRLLPQGWEIYLQPHLNGLRPDFVLLNPNVGIAVFEVKDWDLSAMDYFTERTKGGKARLMGRDHFGTTFSRDKDDPVAKVFRYREKIRTLYCPRLDTNDGLAVITAGVIFPFAPQDEVDALLQPLLDDHCPRPEFHKFHPILGREALSSDRLDLIFPEAAHRTWSKIMSRDLAQDLRGWLEEPNTSAETRTPLEMDRDQRELAQSRTSSGYRRIRGPAGSGKSVVLAARAAELAVQGKEVLFLTFNITLWHHMRDLYVRGLNGRRAKGDVTFNHFHDWCKDICEETGNEGRYKALFSDEDRIDVVLDRELPSLVARCIDEDTEGTLTRYDAIIVDEGQDFAPLWWEVARKLAKPGAEYLLAADVSQDLYDRAGSWTERVMTGAGFSGAWSELKISYRMPPNLTALTRGFAERFLPEQTRLLPTSKQAEFDYGNLRTFWHQVAPGQETPAVLEALRRTMREVLDHGLAHSDVVFLCQTHSRGMQLVDDIAKLRNITFAHTFGGDMQDARKNKVAFWNGREALKAATIHSFKGYEAPALVVLIESLNSASDRALVYTALTRLKDRPSGSILRVICSCDDAARHGRTWPQEAPLVS